MSNDMKLIYENYRHGSMLKSKTLFEMANFTEEQAKIFEHFQVNEGVLTMGASLLSGMKNFYNSIKDWGKEKSIDFIKKMGAAYVEFAKKLRKKGVIKKYRLYDELGAIRLLLTKKHHGLALAIFGAIFKIAGGYAIEKIAKMPELLEKIKDVFESIADGKVAQAMEMLFGDVKDLAEIIKQAIAFSKDARDSEIMSNIGTNVPGMGDLRAIEEAFRKNLGVIK
tara:strand:+ start:140 stop:811 length:672 start_codon:yes stop_codon:yes gene_type:complete